MERLRALAAGAMAAAKGLWARASVATTRGAGVGALIALALIERARTAVRRRRGARPRLIWGPMPIVSIKYWSEAMGRAGYESRTCVRERYAIHKREDFDVYREDFLGEGPRAERWRDWAFFAWTLRNGDVFFRFFDGGFLRYTPFEAWEERILKLAGKSIIVSPYGSDVAVNGHLAGLEEALYADYPILEEMSDEIEAQVRHTTEWADVVVLNWQLGFIPRYDVVWISQLAIDTELWSDPGEDSGFDGRDGDVTILHTPNHRNIKGTSHLERAVGELRERGLRIDLELMQGRPNEEVRAAVKASDIIADQFLLPGYAMAALEAMAVGKPVLVNLSALPDELRSTDAVRQCPAVDTNPGRLREDLRRLVEDPRLRRELGAAGRSFVERFHSYEVVARTWEDVINHVWRGAPLPEPLLPRRR